MPGVLTRPALLEEVRQQRIRFDPAIAENQIGPCTIALRLGHRFQRPRKLETIDTAPFTAAFFNDTSIWDIYEDEETFTIEAGEYVVGFAFEILTVANHLMAFVEPRSPYARPGLSVKLIPTVPPGYSDRLVIELHNQSTRKLTLSAEERIAELTFVQVDRPLGS